MSPNQENFERLEAYLDGALDAPARADVERERFSKPVRLVAGGATRQETVARALAEVPAATQIVVVHDAVRPFVQVDLIRRVVDHARKDGAVILGVPSVDTVKQVERQLIRGTIPRERVVQAQTPQGARCSLMLKAFQEAEDDGFSGTDEASLLERAGSTVAVVAGSPRNFKITQPGDLELAEFYLAGAR